MILIFDLDDTLYPEHLFVESGLRAVARHGAAHYGLDAGAAYAMMLETLKAEGRGHVFDRWLAAHNLLTKRRITECVKVYRHHHPDISLPPAHRRMLHRLQDRYPLYLVTDGHKIAQQRKVEALEIASHFQRVFITHRFGRHNAKPALHCFEKIKQAEARDWGNLLYLGDNPAKDFVSLNSVGAITVRVHTGMHTDALAKPGFDATHHIDTLEAFEPLLETLM
ncbi:MAG: HAD family hydrolase [Pseudomonadota bacterium]